MLSTRGGGFSELGRMTEREASANARRERILRSEFYLALFVFFCLFTLACVSLVVWDPLATAALAVVTVVDAVFAITIVVTNPRLFS
jgi:hypothetical protein